MYNARNALANPHPNTMTRIRIEPNNHNKVMIIMTEARIRYAQQHEGRSTDNYFMRLKATENRLRQGFYIAFTQPQLSVLQFALEEVGQSHLIEIDES